MGESEFTFAGFWARIDWIVYRTAAALVIGTLVGLERQSRDKPAGLRTVILICVGACVFSMVSIVMAGEYVDTTRIAAQIVTGVGFLGAGSIFRSTKAVHGLTTAAGIWMVAALGMACGFGQYSIAFVGTFAILVVLVVFQKLGRSIDNSRAIRKYRIATRDDKIHFSDLNPLFTNAGLSILARNCYRDGEDYVFTFRARGPGANHLSFREKLLHMKGLALQR